MAIDRRIIFFVALCVVVGVVFIGLSTLLTSRSPEPVTTETTETTETVEIPAVGSVEFPMTEDEIALLSDQAKREYNFASEKAREWRADAVLTAEIIEYKDSIDTSNGKDTFIFSSPSLPSYYWTIALDQAQNTDGTNSFERTIYYKEDYNMISRGIMEAAPLQYYKYNFIEAIKKADDLGGRDVRTSNEKYDVSATLVNPNDEHLQWIVTYKVGSVTQYETKIDAFTGEEVDTLTPSTEL